MLLEHVSEVDAGDALHDEVMPVAVLGRIVDPNDVRMIELSDDLRLVEEALDGQLVGEAIGMNHLQGVDAPQSAMTSLEDLAHCAFAKPIKQNVLAEAQFRPVAAQQQLDLVGRQQSACQQCIGNDLGIGLPTEFEMDSINLI